MVQNQLAQPRPAATQGATRASYPPARRIRQAGLFLAFAGLIWAAYKTGLGQGDLVNWGGRIQVQRFLSASLHPELAAGFLWLTLKATLATLAFAISATFLGIVFGFIGGILASEVWWQSFTPGQVLGKRSPLRIFWLSLRGLLSLLRAVHEIIWGLLLINILGLDPLTAIIGIAIPNGAYMAKVFAETLDETPKEALHALLGSGAPPARAFVYSILPQAGRDLLAYSFYRFECTIRSAALLGIIGAGGLGYEIFLSLQTLKYEQIWTLFYALFAINGLADLWSSALRRRLGGGPSCAGINCEMPLQASRPPQLDRLVRGSLVAGVIAVPLAFIYLKPQFGRLLSRRSFTLLSDLTRQAFPPDFSILATGEWLSQVQITLAMSILAIGLVALPALLLAFPAANNVFTPAGIFSTPGRTGMSGVPAQMALALTRGILLVMRSVPAPIWALVFLFMLFPGILPGAIALGIYTLGVLGRLLAEIIENLDTRPLEALRALGAGGGQVAAYGLLPLTTPRFITYLLSRWEEALRATVAVGVVGAGGLGRQLSEQLSSFYYPGVLAILVIFIALVFLFDRLSIIARRAVKAG